MDMVQDLTVSNTWRSRSGGSELVLRALGDGRFLLVDGAGTQYSFEPIFSGAKLWVLKEIRLIGNRNVANFDYRIEAGNWTKPGFSAQNAVVLALTAIRYNTYPSDEQCMKNEVTLDYDPDEPVLAVQFLEETPFVQVNKVRSVSVKAREGNCGALRQLRRYRFHYGEDLTTRLPRLRSVSMVGREGTPEGNEANALPVGTYRYGNATTDDGLVLHYEKVPQDVALDSSQIQDGIGISGRTTDPYLDVPRSQTNLLHMEHQQLGDVNGDGRADLIYRNGYETWVAFGKVGGHGETRFEPGRWWFGTNSGSIGYAAPVVTSTRLADVRSSRPLQLWNDRREDTYRDSNVDFDGDGRLDIVDAEAGGPYEWRV